MKPFLLLATRAEDRAADDEYGAFCAFAGLAPRQLVRHRLERDPLGDVDLDAWSGIIVGGSPYNASDAFDRKSGQQQRAEAEMARLLDRVVAADFPFLGACYGVGTLGVHQGAVVDATYAEPVGPALITVTDAGRSDPLLAGLPDSFWALVGHKEAISVLPGHAVLLATGESCPVQMFRVGRNVYATQFHPELDADGLATRIDVYVNHGYFRPHEAEALKEAGRSADISHAPQVLRTFVETYGRD